MRCILLVRQLSEGGTLDIQGSFMSKVPRAGATIVEFNKLTYEPDLEKVGFPSSPCTVTQAGA